MPLVARSMAQARSQFKDILAFEAAMIASNFPPNFYRKEFAFERWKDWDYKLFELIKKSLLKKVKKIYLTA